MELPYVYPRQRGTTSKHSLAKIRPMHTNPFESSHLGIPSWEVTSHLSGTTLINIALNNEVELQE